jgi:5-methylcytosine-specific restriction enzyme subunit McrC
LTDRTVSLVERRTRTVKLPRLDADFLLAYARNLIEVVPTFQRGVYQLTPRGFVGFLDGPTVRYAIGPKIPWPNLRLLLGLAQAPTGEPVEPAGGLLAVLATAFAEQLEAVVRAGLVAGYSEAARVSPFLRGKLRTADQMRDAAARAFPDQFHIEEAVFDLHTPWNRIAKATATALLRHELPLELRQRIEAAALPLAVVPYELATAADFTTAFAEPRVVGYRTLLEVCRLLFDGLNGTDPLNRPAGAFLINLETAFERYLTAGLERELVSRPGWRVEAQPVFVLGPTTLQPDILVRKDEAPWAVLDAKWKRATYESADLHQILAYATLTGAPRVALVHPGSSDRPAQFSTPDGKVRVSVFRLRVVGTEVQLGRSIARLARMVRKG